MCKSFPDHGFGMPDIDPSVALAQAMRKGHAPRDLLAEAGDRSAFKRDRFDWSRQRQSANTPRPHPHN
jgi:hypothetical protein